MLKAELRADEVDPLFEICRNTIAVSKKTIQSIAINSIFGIGMVYKRCW